MNKRNVVFLNNQRHNLYKKSRHNCVTFTPIYLMNVVVNVAKATSSHHSQQKDLIKICYMKIIAM